MTLKRLLHLCISILRHLKSYVQLPLQSLLWLLSKLGRIVDLGRRTPPPSRVSSEGSKDINSFFCASQQQPPRAENGELQGPSLEMTQVIPGPAALSIQPSEPNPSQPRSYSSLSQVPKLTTTGAPAPTPEKSEHNLGFPRPDLCTEVENLLAIAPTEYQRYDRNEVMFV